MNKTLDTKLLRIRTDSACADFILADAKDADMAFGIAAPGHSRTSSESFCSLSQYRQTIREVVQEGMIDICLMSASTNELLTINERLFENSSVTPAVRMNDTTDIWLTKSNTAYHRQPSLPFRSTTIEEASCSKCQYSAAECEIVTDLGLYSVTFNNDAELDRATLEGYRSFRLEAERKGFRYFLEVFPPNVCKEKHPTDVGAFLNDHIVRMLAGITSHSRPIFLKMPYFGSRCLFSLLNYDPTIIVGILGGGAGTTHDAFHLLREAKRHGAQGGAFRSKDQRGRTSANICTLSPSHRGWPDRT